MSGGQARGVLAFQRVGQVQPARFFSCGLVSTQADVGTALRICHAQDLPALQDKQRCPPPGSVSSRKIVMVFTIYPLKA